MIEEVVLDRRMPPWHADPHFGKFSNDRSMTGEESQELLRWIRQGCPRGEGDDPLPAASVAAVKAEGWALGQPDFVAKLPTQDSLAKRIDRDAGNSLLTKSAWLDSVGLGRRWRLIGWHWVDSGIVSRRCW
jgi:hypothetical protein